MGFAMDRQLHSGGLLASFPVVLLSQPNSGTPSVLVDKLNPGFFKRTSHRQVIGHGHGGFILRTLSPLDCRNAQRGFTGKVFGARRFGLKESVEVIFAEGVGFET
jgi:hypothetical protein